MRRDAFATLLAMFAAAAVMTLGGSASAKTPDGMPPSEETVCSGLEGAAFGLCNAYCEAQDCDVHPRPSCAVLLRNFRRLTGMPAFPCDSRCGDGVVDPGEECDPGSPLAICPCTADCLCEDVPLGCCECTGNICVDEPATGCPAGCFTLPGLTCNPLTGTCGGSTGVCCECDTAPCFDTDQAENCLAQGCIPRSDAVCSLDGCLGSVP